MRKFSILLALLLIPAMFLTGCSKLLSAMGFDVKEKSPAVTQEAVPQETAKETEKPAPKPVADEGEKTAQPTKPPMSQTELEAQQKFEQLGAYLEQLQANEKNKALANGNLSKARPLSCNLVYSFEGSFTGAGKKESLVVLSVPTGDAPSFIAGVFSGGKNLTAKEFKEQEIYVEPQRAKSGVDYALIVTISHSDLHGKHGVGLYNIGKNWDQSIPNEIGCITDDTFTLAGDGVVNMYNCIAPSASLRMNSLDHRLVFNPQTAKMDYKDVPNSERVMYFYDSSMQISLTVPPEYYGKYKLASKTEEKYFYYEFNYRDGDYLLPLFIIKIPIGFDTPPPPVYDSIVDFSGVPVYLLTPSAEPDAAHKAEYEDIHNRMYDIFRSFGGAPVDLAKAKYPG